MILYLRKFTFILFVLLSTLSYAQESIVDKVICVRQLVRESKTDEALAQLAQIEQSCVLSSNDTIKAIFLELKGQALFNVQRYEECIPLCKEAISLFERANLRQYEYLDAWGIIATAYHRLQDYINAEKYYRKGILRSVTARVDDMQLYRSNLWLNLGNLYNTQGDTLLAEECYQRSQISSERKPIDIDQYNYLEWENALWDDVNSLVNQTKYEEAVVLYEKLINGIREKQGISDSYLLAVYSRGILFSRFLNKYDEAKALFEETISLRNHFLIPQEEICGAYCNLALCHSVLGDFASVRQIESEAIIYLTEANIQDYATQMFYRFVGNGAYWTENYEQAIVYYEKYLNPQYVKEKGTSYEEITNQLSVSYIKSNYPSKAKDLLLSLLCKEETVLEKDNKELLATIYHNLGRAYMLLQDKKNALSYLNKSRDLQILLYENVAERTEQYIQECHTN